MESSRKYLENNSSDFYHLSFINLSDGKLRTEDGGMFPIHKFNLARKSNYFYALFCGMGREKNDILIPGIKKEVLSNILSYLYTGDIHTTEENMCELIIASDYLVLDDLIFLLKQHLKEKLTIANSLTIFKTALEINRDDILRVSFRFVQTHFESIVHSMNSSIGDLPLDAFKVLLSDKNLCVRSETTTWLAIVNWVEADTVNRLSRVLDLLMYLVIEDVDENIADCILQHDIVQKNPSCHQILDVKSHLQNANNLTVLRIYFQAYPRPMLPLFDHRQPSKLYYIAHYTTINRRHGVRIYLTYDENIDLWRQIAEVDLSPGFLFAINDCIYMLRTRERNMCYNVTQKEWEVLSDFRIPRCNYGALELDGFLYVLGGISEATGWETYEVEYYDYELDEWFTTTPMIPVTSFAAVAYNSCIYVVGNKLTDEGYEMVCQVYDSSSETWNLLPSLSTRLNFAMTVYNNMIYVFGGCDDDLEILKTVRVFDPINNYWSDAVDLPYAYYLPKAIVLNGKLIVFDDHIEDRNYLKTSPAVQWDSDKQCWKPFEESSSMNNMHMYCFFSLENSDSINIISNENKDPATNFEISPFE